MQEKKTNLLREIADYYSEKLLKYGETPLGVDWNGEESQNLRFLQLSKVINKRGDFSLNDLGCGYGALYEHLSKNYDRFFYSGIDVSKAMIQSAQMRYGNKPNARFTLDNKPDQVADYGIASGIFNVRQKRSEIEWRNYIESTLDILDHTSRSGFAFNCLTVYSDKSKMRDYLHYADPCTLFDFCKKRYSKNVALLHDYGLYEFTLIIRKCL
ncbi:MAG: SAM-dependent methyltransferase [Deltaproteobacteria bacterium]|nr:MAG: SAM-dependent methyltransferase [Deltaproteobacteria bacterium]